MIDVQVISIIAIDAVALLVVVDNDDTVVVL